MKRVYSRLTLLLILCLLPIPTLSITWIPEVKGAEQVFFEENFENYNVGTFPSSGGWELWYNGAGTELQVIVDNVSVSPTKSLKLLGVDYWAGFAAKRFTSTSSTIGFEVAVRVEENNGQPRDDARVAFTTNVNGYISREYAPVTFQDSGVITSGGQVLQSYVADKWYKIMVIMNRDREAYSVWVDGELKGENLAVTTTSGDITDYPSYEIEAFSVSQCYNSVAAYFDDVKVFEVSEVNPRLELVPNKGIAATTLVGTGFAPNSQISVTWDDIPIPTVPSPLITDSYGNFTAIISVLNQTTAGVYTVKAVDETGTEATATFTVTLEAQPQSAEEQNSETPPMSGLPPSLELLGGGARWAAEEGSSALFINWKDNWLAHHLTDGTDWGPWPQDMDDRRFSVAYALEQAGFDVDFAGDIPETLTNYDLIVIDAYWAVEPQDASLIKGYISDGGGVVILGGVPCYFSVYCKDAWPYRAYGSEFDGYRFGLEPIQEWFGARYYINVDEYPHLAFDNPFGTTLSVGDTLMEVESKDAASVTTLSSNTQLVAQWDSGKVFSFTHKYGQGRLYYQASYECISADILETREPAVKTHITVPDDYPTIQEAINAADDGDTILVYSGTYYENVIVNKTLTVKSQSGAETTIVCTPDPESGKNVFEITANSVELTGFTIKDSTTRTIQGDPYNPSSYVDACGIYTATCTGTKITRNIVKNNFEGIVFADCSDILVSENQITGNIHEGIRLAYSTSATVIKNNIIGNHFPGLSTATGLVFFHCSDSSVTENQIVANNNGAVVNNSHDITVSSNNITANGFHGLNLVNGYSNTVFGNIMKKNTYGICPSGATDTQIYENILQENEHGIACYGASNNFVYHNCFINNSRQVSNFHGTETNSYDNGYRSGGNYWSDYIGVDYNGDGIGETPYIIDENNRDNYPLMSPDIVNSSPSHQSTVDTAPPNITDVSQAPVSINGTLEEGVRVTATVTDAASEVERVALKYSYGNGTWVTVEMTKLEGDVWVGIIPAFPHGTNVTYTIIAEDKEGNTVTTEEQPGAPNQYDVLPEFPLWIGLPLFLIAVASALVVRKRASSPVFTKICNRLHKLLT